MNCYFHYIALNCYFHFIALNYYFHCFQLNCSCHRIALNCSCHCIQFSDPGMSNHAARTTQVALPNVSSQFKPAVHRTYAVQMWPVASRYRRNSLETSCAVLVIWQESSGVSQNAVSCDLGQSCTELRAFFERLARWRSDIWDLVWKRDAYRTSNSVNKASRQCKENRRIQQNLPSHSWSPPCVYSTRRGLPKYFVNGALKSVGWHIDLCQMCCAWLQTAPNVIFMLRGSLFSFPAQTAGLNIWPPACWSRGSSVRPVTCLRSVTPVLIISCCGVSKGRS